MRVLFVVATVAVALAAGPAAAVPQDAAEQALAQRAEACIQAGAPAVAAEPGSLSEGVDFLVNDLCLVDVHHFTSYVQHQRQLDEWRKASQSPPIGFSIGNPSPEALKSVEAEQQAEIAKVSLDPNTGELITPPDFTPPVNTSAILSLAINADADPGARFKVFAAQALLAARKAPSH